MIAADSAAVRKYCPFDRFGHPTVDILQTVVKGQVLSIQGQTFNDYIVLTAKGEEGVLSKADVKISEPSTPANSLSDAQPK